MKSSGRTLIFDGQVFQSAAWDRGMGKYSLGLLRAMVAHADYSVDRTIIIFTKHMSLSPEAEQLLKAAAPHAEFVFLDLRAPNNHPDEDISPLQATNKRIIDIFVKNEMITDFDFMILSLFIDQVASVYPSAARKVLLFYDLIPLQYSERYGQSPAFKGYLARYNVFFEADIILTISQTVADDLVVYTGISPQRVFNIDGAPIEREHHTPTRPVDFKETPYILMPSGNDIRKNNHRAIQAFEEFRHTLTDQTIRLVLTSHFDSYTRGQLSRLSPNVEFVGNVSEAELRWLYEHAKALLFVSEYEGLGLPVLEAAEVNIPVVCSSLTVFNEMSTTAFYYADQHNPTNIAAALELALRRDAFEEKQSEYPAILERYTWSNTAMSAIKVLSTAPIPEVVTIKPRIAVFAPNPAGYSAIGKVVMLMHAALSQVFDVDYYLEDGRSDNSFGRASYLPSVARVYRAAEFTAVRYAQYDAVFYHVGNSEYHLESIKNALHLPGYIIAHDTKLKDVFEDVLYRFGYMDAQRLAAERLLDEMSKTTKTSYTTSLINAQLGIVTHSDYANKALQSVNITHVPIRTAHLPVGTPTMSRLKPKSAPFKIGFGGIIHKAKGINMVDNLLSAEELRDAEIYIFGVPLIDQQVLERLEAHPNVHIEKNLTDFAFENRLADMDVIVSYRPTYNGETSLTVIEAMRYGVVPIVRAIGWFDELPDDSVQKVKDEAGILKALVALKKDPALLRAKSQAARKLMKDEYDYRGYVQAMKALIEATTQGNSNTVIADALKKSVTKPGLLKLLG